jgi:predicted nucleic acid-binding protein
MRKLKIYLDNCCYGRPFDNQDDIEIYNETQAKMLIQSLIKTKEIELAYSSISVEEIGGYPFEENRNAILGFIEDNATYYVDKDRDETAIAMTEEIMKTGVRLKDASHTACAIIAKCDYLVTTDKRLIKHQDNRVKIVSPISFMEIWRDSNV